MRFPLLHLFLLLLRGRMKRALSLARQPRYLIGLIFAVLWLVIWIGPGLVGASPVRITSVDDLLSGSSRWLEALQTLVALLMALAVTAWWLFPKGSPALPLTQADIHTLLPAPLSRRQVLQYAILKNQAPILFGCLVASLVAAGGSPLRFLFFWLLLTNWDLHAKARNLWIAGNRELPAARAWRRRAGLVLGMAAFWGVLLLFASGPLVSASAQLRQQANETALNGMADALASPHLSLLLTPFSLLLGLHFSPSGVFGWAGWVSLGFNVLLLLVQNEWVVRSAARFEDATLEKARVAHRSRKGLPEYWRKSVAKRRSVPFRLRPGGTPEMAVLWKNLIALDRTPLVRRVVSGAALVAGLTLVLFFLPLPDWVYGFLTTAGIVFCIFFPLFSANGFRNDLRADMTRLELLRTWPVAPWKLFLSEVSGPTLQAAQFWFVGAAVTVSAHAAIDFRRLTEMQLMVAQWTPEGFSPPILLLLVLLGLSPLMVAGTAYSTAVHNLLAVILPGWVALGLGRREAAANFGQNLVMSVVLLVSFGVGFVPTSILVILLLVFQVGVLQIPFSPFEIPFLGCVASLPLLMLLVVMVWLGGKAWGQLDPSRQLLSSN